MSEQKKRDCDYCGGFGQWLDDEDFCPKCGSPSQRYRESIYREMEMNGELDPPYFSMI